jgi:hypothetical protein
MTPIEPHDRWPTPDVMLSLLASGNYFEHRGFVTADGSAGLILTVVAACLSFSSVSEAADGRQVVSVDDLAKG